LQAPRLVLKKMEEKGYIKFRIPKEGIKNLAYFKRNKNLKKENEPKLSFSDDLITLYTAFKNQVYNPKSVLNPSCGFDASPAKVFDNVTFVDIAKDNAGCIKKLQEAGFHAIKQDIRDYKPNEEHDLLILINPVIPTEWASRHLKSGGYVLAK